jgi:hypothetical protein
MHSNKFAGLEGPSQRRIARELEIDRERTATHTVTVPGIASGPEVPNIPLGDLTRLSVIQSWLEALQRVLHYHDYPGVYLSDHRRPYSRSNETYDTTDLKLAHLTAWRLRRAQRNCDRYSPNISHTTISHTTSA